MDIYSPFTLTLKESQRDAASWREAVENMNISDETLREYAEVFLDQYRFTLNRFFSTIGPFIPFYAQAPYKTIIVRMGPNGVIIGHRPEATATIEVIKADDFDPPLDSFNIFEIVNRLQMSFCRFDFSIRTYDREEAEVNATRAALTDALKYFWQTLDEAKFSSLCIELLKAENIDLEVDKPNNQIIGYDVLGEVLLSEPAGFRRVERWSFEFKHHRNERVSASYLREIEQHLLEADSTSDIICLMTSGDLTSIGRHIAVGNSRIRVWDRSILNKLIHQYLPLLESYFSDYSSVISTLSQELTQVEADNLEKFSRKLDNCPFGQKYFSEYEKIVTEIWQYLFSPTLGEPKSQRRTFDGVQRRDVLFKNNRSTKFFQRLFEKFSADFIIVDAKNYEDPISSDVIDSVAKYANKALGRFITIVSRQGAEQATEAARVRIYRDEDTLVLVLSDTQILEMVARKGRGESPEDLIEDVLDEFLIRF
jgi:hypothetical protein